jgi:hypothetical protein
MKLLNSRGSSVAIAIGYGLDDLGFGVRVQVGERMFMSCRQFVGPTQLPIHCVQENLSPKVTTHLHLVLRS